MSLPYEQSAFVLSGVPSRLLIRTPFDLGDDTQDQPAVQAGPLSLGGTQDQPAVRVGRVPAPTFTGQNQPAVRV